MPEPTTHEFEHSGTAAEAGALLRSLGTDLERGKPLQFETETGVVTVDVPDELAVEVEVERVEDEVELEVDLEWDDPEDATVTTAADADEAAATTVEDAPSKATFELFQDRADEWRWRLRHDNGNIIADSGEGYGSVSGARNGLRSVRENAPGAPVDRQD